VIKNSNKDDLSFFPKDIADKVQMLVGHACWTKDEALKVVDHLEKKGRAIFDIEAFGNLSGNPLVLDFSFQESKMFDGNDWNKHVKECSDNARTYLNKAVDEGGSPVFLQWKGDDRYENEIKKLKSSLDKCETRNIYFNIEWLDREEEEGLLKNPPKLK